jgi:hypothetical protein
MHQKYLFIAILSVKMSRVNKALGFSSVVEKFKCVPILPNHRPEIWKGWVITSLNFLHKSGKSFLAT